jgi:hypothetical protein
MEIYRKLTVTGEPSQIDAWLRRSEADLTPGWSRDLDFESRYAGPHRVASGCLAFQFQGSDTIPSGSLILDRPESARLEDLTYLADNLDRIETTQYNAILDDFASEVIEPCKSRFGLRVELSSETFFLTDWMSRATAEKLVLFSREAHKDYGTSLPADRERWLDFVVSAQREQCTLSGRLLRRWLTEVGGWESEMAEALAGEFAFGREVLAYSSEKQQSV